MIIEALMCLALNVYHEARDQPFIGQVAVAQVVMNRVDDNRFPNTICEVVKQGPTYKYNPGFPVRHKCQFSWWCDGKSDKVKDEQSWMNALEVADLVMNDRISIDVVDKSTHYHAYYVRPAWAKRKNKVARIEDHIFYNWN
jgi:N-acetylmuramoyl-L-alanine amidase